ncbi:hypothetical protein MMC24_001350 [Lignoscripta atroalba]|nr:hypothetical protein [Lignoscripta atroalba]
MPYTLLYIFLVLSFVLRLIATPVTSGDGDRLSSSWTTRLQASTAHALEARDLNNDSGYVTVATFIDSRSVTRTLTSELSPTSAILNIHIKDSTGKDISDNVTVLHHQHNPSSSTNQKRYENSVVLDICPEIDEIFQGSACVRTETPQKYYIICSGTYYYNTCLPQDICVDGVPYIPPAMALWPGPPLLSAWCFHTDAFAKVTQTKVAGESQVVAVTWPFFGLPVLKYTVQAVMTGLDITKKEFAAELLIQAQVIETYNNINRWRGLRGGTNECKDCASIGLSPVPEEAQMIRVDVILKQSTVEGAFLYFAQIIETPHLSNVLDRPA